MGSKDNQFTDLDPLAIKELGDLGLDIAVVASHQKNIKNYLHSDSPRFFPIKDTCRLDNGGILPLPVDPGFIDNCGMAAFVPSAGASTRFVAPLSDLIKALEKVSLPDCQRSIFDLVDAGLLNTPLPESLRLLMEDVSKEGLSNLSRDQATAILSDLEVPKALYPAVRSGETFIEIKRHEHKNIDEFVGEVYVAPPGKMDALLTKAKMVESKTPIVCYEQGLELSTARFDENGCVIRDADNRISLVPAGHGTLIHLIRKVPRDFPAAHAVFIRNIDNISGTSQAVTQATRRFINSFKYSLKLIRRIRSAFLNQDRSTLIKLFSNLADFWGVKSDVASDKIKLVMTQLFHVSPRDDRELLEFINRPFVLMGQVPNTGNDVGGTCVFSRINGIDQKLCLELPHSSPVDRKDFLESSVKATHFNPVFVAAEIPDESMIARMMDHPFWLISKKQWKGREVFYQESILYELLGSSQYTNVIFVEVPRYLFNPHKTLQDAKHKKFHDWIAF